MTEDHEPHKPRWVELLKAASGITALLYAAGFLSMRSWLNLLGVWTGPPLVDQTYLAEGAAVFVTTAEKLLFPWLFVAVLALLVITAAKRARDAIRRRPANPGRSPSGRHVPPWLASVGALAVLAVLLKVVDTRLLESLREPQSLLLVRPRPALAQPDEYQFCVAAVAAVALACLALWRGWVRLDRGQAVARWVLLGLLAFAAFLLPMNFARTARPRVAPVARLVATGDKAVPADLVFLLLTNDKELTVYDGESISTLDRKDVRAFEILCHASVLDAPACPGRGGDARGAPGGWSRGDSRARNQTDTAGSD